MKKLNYSNFELLEDIIGSLSFDYSQDRVEILNKLSEIWVDIVGYKCSQKSKVLEVSDDNILTVVCADSFVANELYLRKDNLLKSMCKKIAEQGIKLEVADLNINYRRWK